MFLVTEDNAVLLHAAGEKATPPPADKPLRLMANEPMNCPAHIRDLREAIGRTLRHTVFGTGLSALACRAQPFGSADGEEIKAPL